MSVSFLRGQQLGRNDLIICPENASGHPVNPAEISYAIYDFTTGMEVLVGPPARTPVNPSVGEFYASLGVPLDANIGAYRIRWTLREVVGGPIQTAVQEFEIRDRDGTSIATFPEVHAELIRRLRIALRDNNPDRNYKFRPPAHEETVDQFSRVFGYIWEDYELQDFLMRGVNDIEMAPPRTPFGSIEALVQIRREWTSLLLTAASVWAFQALQANWVADEYGYSIGGVSLDLEKSSKYESLKQGAKEQFDTMLERAKATVKIIKGLQQPKFGAGIRSSFGPHMGRGVLSPRKFLGV